MAKKTIHMARIIGAFNAYNVLAVYAVAQLLRYVLIRVNIPLRKAISFQRLLSLASTRLLFSLVAEIQRHSLLNFFWIPMLMAKVKT